MNPLAKRIRKMESAVVEQRGNVILDYWDDALDSDPEAAELRKQLNQQFESSTIKPPVFFMPDKDSDTRRWYWYCMTNPQAREILNALSRKVDKYVDSIGGLFAERKREPKKQ
jgi:hypothetical protein